MESTSEFVSKVKETQEKQRKNRERFGKGTPNQKLNSKKHSNNS